MTFKLNLNSIDTNFPVPGIDNPSQGFRDNFSIIENNFVELDDVVGTLDEVSVRLNAENNFNGQGTLENVTLKQAKQVANTSNENGTSTDTIDCNWDEAVFYVIKVSNSLEPLTINLQNWPNSGYAKMTLLLTKTDASDRTIIWTAPPLALLQPATIKKLNFPTTTSVLVNVTTNELTVSSHNFTNGTPVTVVADVLPTGLSASTTYYVKVINNVTITLHTTKSVSDNPIDISSTGTNVTLVPFLNLDVEDPTMIEAVTYDAGETVLLRYVGKFE